MEKINKYKYLNSKYLGSEFENTEFFNKSILHIVPLIKEMDRGQLSNILYTADLKLVENGQLEKTLVYKMFDINENDNIEGFLRNTYKRLPQDQLTLMLLESIASDGGFSNVSSLVMEANNMNYNVFNYIFSELKDFYKNESHSAPLTKTSYENVDDLNEVIENSLNNMVFNHVKDFLGYEHEDLLIHSYLSKGVLNQDKTLHYSTHVNDNVLTFLVDLNYAFDKMKIFKITAKAL